MISGIVSLVIGIVGAAVAFVVTIVGLVVGLAVPILLSIALPLVIFGVPLLLVMVVVWLLGLPSARRAHRREPGETRLIQDINRGLARMENRLNSLETVMMDNEQRKYSIR